MDTRETTTSAPSPVVTTPTPVTQAPLDPVMYVFIHKDTFDRNGSMHVLTSRFGSVVLEPYRQMELNQVFLTDKTRIRSLSGRGDYLDHNPYCTAPVMVQSPSSSWRFLKTDTGPYSYRIVSSCGSPLHAVVGRTTVDLFQHAEGETWYVIPVGTVEMDQ